MAKRRAEVAIEYTTGGEGEPMFVPKDKANSSPPPDDSFRPTKRMEFAKIKFHKLCPDSLVTTLIQDLPVTSFDFEGTQMPLVEYMRGVSPLEFEEWTFKKGFWNWFIDNSEAEKLEVTKTKLENKSYELLDKILSIDAVNEIGEVDAKVLALQLKAIELAVGRKQNAPTINKTVNNLKFGAIPKNLAKLPEATLRRDLKQLQAMNAPAKRGRKPKNEEIC